MKPMTLCGVSAPKNKFLRIPASHRHHWRGYPYIIYKIASHAKMADKLPQKYFCIACRATTDTLFQPIFWQMFLNGQ